MTALNLFFALDRLRIALVAIALSGLTLGCGVRGSGVIIEERRSVTWFDAVELGDGFVGRVEYGSEFEVYIEADDNLMDEVRTRVVGGRLIIDLDGLSTSRATLRATVTVPELRAAEVRDGGIVDVEDVPFADDFDLELSGGSIGRIDAPSDTQLSSLFIDNSGGGSFVVSADVDTTLIDVSGGGTGTISGSSRRLTTSLSGGSHMDASSFVTSYLSFDLSGGSLAEVEVRTEARGDLSGGSILQVGGWADVSATTSGGSSVQRR